MQMGLQNSFILSVVVNVFIPFMLSPFEGSGGFYRAKVGSAKVVVRSMNRFISVVFVVDSPKFRLYIYIFRS